MKKFLNKILDFNGKEIKKLNKIVAKVNALEESIQRLSDSELQDKTHAFRTQLEHGTTLDALLPEAFAVVREAAKRTTGMRAYDVQVLGGIVLHQGRIAEMRTGEGKTLAATMPVYLNALTGKGVHVVTVNDYLATRDSEWMGQIYRFMGLKVGLIVNGMTPAERYQSYRCDVIYGTNNEFGFDYLRDNMATEHRNIVQRPLHYAIIDEVDSILVDEARTPLIISGSMDAPVAQYRRFAQLARMLKRDIDYEVDEKARTVSPTASGIASAERWLHVDNLFEPGRMEMSHNLNAALKAKELMKRDRDYIIKENEIIIVDAFTGRLMHGRRYSDGLHQAIEAKENVRVAKESKTLATITLQNYFRMYTKLSGMTGTAKTEEQEFQTIYGMDVVVIPTNKPMVRVDLADQIYQTEQAKFKAVIKDIEARHAKGQPVLVGTVSIENSEILSNLLKKRRIKHNVLNAKYHEQEAEIVKDAGQGHMVTIATNMAGRGTDIELGEGVIAAGGLHVIGTERHESRRIDNQLRGRSGRQGDPGSSQFYVSLEDDLMRLFASNTAATFIGKMGLEEDVPIEHSLLDKAIEKAQEKVEGRNFNIRKHVLEYDNIMNKQREIIYAEREKILKGLELQTQILAMMHAVYQRALAIYCSPDIYEEEWDFIGLNKYLHDFFPMFNLDMSDWQTLDQKTLLDRLQTHGKALYRQREDEFGSDKMRLLERLVMLHVVDQKWMDHIDAMSDLRQGVGLRAYGGRNPLIEYQKESYEMFEAMNTSIQEDIVRNLFRMQIVEPSSKPKQAVTTNAPKQQRKSKPRKTTKIGRNEPCPCGSGKKYKHCCGR